MGALLAALLLGGLHLLLLLLCWHAPTAQALVALALPEVQQTAAAASGLLLPELTRAQTAAPLLHQLCLRCPS